MNRMYYRGRMERGIAPFHFDRRGCHLSPDGFPTRVCTRCGEVCFDEGRAQATGELPSALDHWING
jgi:YgiT-type zinc finger domain-containing protein